MSARNWTVKEYTNDTWTKLVTSPTEVDCIIVANTSVGSINVSIRLTDDAGTERAIILPTKAVATVTAETLSIPGFKVGKKDVLEVKASAAGVHFTASGDDAN